MSGENLGAMGEFPEGKITPDDEGTIHLAVAHNDKVVAITFGKPIAWVAMGPAQARAFAALLIQHANECPAAG